MNRKSKYYNIAMHRIMDHLENLSESDCYPEFKGGNATERADNVFSHLVYMLTYDSDNPEETGFWEVEGWNTKSNAAIDRHAVDLVEDFIKRAKNGSLATEWAGAEYGSYTWRRRKGINILIPLLDGMDLEHYQSVLKRAYREANVRTKEINLHGMGCLLKWVDIDAWAALIIQWRPGSYIKCTLNGEGNILRLAVIVNYGEAVYAEDWAAAYKLIGKLDPRRAKSMEKLCRMEDAKSEQTLMFDHLAIYKANRPSHDALLDDLRKGKWVYFEPGESADYSIWRDHIEATTGVPAHARHS